ncbi:uncharacterized protein [Lolium perenne]|uniref:uncharacterized protein n=1 Tax=Lolium perenne TaxID=4522 RepID=UPI003A9A4691
MNRRQWMYVDRRLPEFRSGLEEFIRVALANPQADGFMCCPCVDCHNLKQYPEWQVIHSHLLWKGFMPSYNCWTKHGERGVMMEDDEEEEEDDDMYPNYGDTATGHDEDEDAGGGDQDEEASDEPVDDDLRRAIADAHRDAETENEKRKLKGMLDDHKKKLYPNCEDGNTKLGATLELLQWKAEAGICDKPFEKLLKIMKRRFPKNNELPDSTYEAKKVLCPLGLEVLKIHACINDCILYRAEYENLEKCPVCTALRYKIRRDDPGDVEGEPPRKRVPAKVMWYAPIIPRLKRLFRNKEHARLLRWHKEDRKKDEMLRHPADGSQWRTIDREFPDFADDARNLRFGLSTDGMNPFGEQSCSHSTWPVTLCIYNLPPWLCMKRKFIMMPVLIQGPKQPGNDIDVYLQPLFEELLQLWSKPGVHAWDEYKQESFNLRALLFVTINDWPALSNLSGQTNKGYNACTHCLDETEGAYLHKCKKVVYLGHRRFLPKRHPVRKKGNHFGGEADRRVKPELRTGDALLDMVKDLKVIFGKGPGGQSVPNDDVTGHAPMWKKKSIFWDLPYWKVLEVRSSIDVMHVTKNLCVNLLGFLGVYGKTKDTPEAREDQYRMKVPKDKQEQDYKDTGSRLSPTSYALTKAEKDIFFEVLYSIKVPSGFSSNIKGIINMEKKTFQNLKSHDCHIIMTQLLPVALRGLLPENVRIPIVKLCAFLNAISQKVIDPASLPRLQKDVVQCLVSFELVFPPSFFNIMTHLLVHLVEEIAILGPVFLHNMFPFERFMGVLKKYVHNRARPKEASPRAMEQRRSSSYVLTSFPTLSRLVF